MSRNHLLGVSGSLLLLATCVILSLASGAGPYSLQSLWMHALGDSVLLGDGQAVDIFWQSRLPRTLAAAMVGSGLALSAALLQSITRNPLAEPGLLGVNAGGVFGLILGMHFFAAASVGSYMMWSGAGALLAILLVLAIGGLSKRRSPPQLILIGMATSAVLGGIANYILMSADTVLERFRFWNLGSLAGVKMAAVSGVFPYFVIACGAIFVMTRWLMVMQLGDDKAQTMGVPTALVTFAVWVTTAVLTAGAIAIAGPIMFAGFLAAYFARYMAGPRFGLQLFYAGLFGMILVLVSDIAARLIIRPYELPVSVMIALVGTPLTIVVSRSRQFRSALVGDYHL